MAMQAEEIIKRIAVLHPDAVIEVAGEECSFEVYVVSDEFADKLTLQRQQPILSLFHEELSNGKLHALSVKAKTRAELSSQAAFVQIQLG